MTSQLLRPDSGDHRDSSPAHSMYASAGHLTSPALAALCSPVPGGGDDPAPLQISDQGALFLIRDGAADLFAVAHSPDGRWVPLGRAVAGIALAPALAPGSGHSIVARPIPGSSIVTLPLATLGSLSVTQSESNGALRAELARAVDAGLSLLTAAIGEALPPRSFMPLDVGATAQLPRGRAARSVDGVLWVDVVSGTVHVGMDDLHARHVSGDRVALTGTEFLVAESEAVLRTRGTAQLLAGGTLAAALELHGYRFGYAVARAMERLVDNENERLAARRGHDVRLDESTRRVLESLLTEEHRGQFVGTETEDTATRALRLVASRSGVEMAERMPTISTEGDDRARIVQLAAALGMPLRKVRLAGRWWRSESGPLIGYRKRGGGAVALLRGPNGYVIRDVAGGPDVPVGAATMRELDVYGTMVYATLPDSVDRPRALLRFGFRASGRDVRRLLRAAVVIAVVQLSVPVLTGTALGYWVPAAKTSLVVTGAIALVAGAVVVAAMTVLQNIAILRLEGRLDLGLQSAIWARVLNLPLRFYSRYSAAELGTRTLGVTAAREALSNVVTIALIGSVSGLANLALLCWYSLPLGLICAGLMAAGVVATSLLARRGVDHQRRLYLAEQRLTSVGYQLLSGVATLRQAAAETRAHARWSQVLAASVNAAVAVRRNQSAVLVVCTTVCSLCTVATFAVAGGPLAGRITLPAFLAFYAALGLVLAAAQQLAATVVATYPVVPMFEGLQPILAARPENTAQRAQPGELEGRIEVRDVSFRYDAGPLVLDDISLTVERGEFVAIVGPTGSGKSSVLRLLLGFEEPESGSILYDGQDMRQLDLQGLRRQFGVVLQNGTLLPDDISANILAGRPYTEADVWRAAELAGIAADIKAMPMGLRTVLAEGGGTLSGGQRQRLMIARALLTSPRILLFDEATSALDNATQRVVAESTRRLRATRVVIAHRLSTVVDADRILVLDRGAVVQSGTYAELVADPAGLFARLVQRQRLVEDE